MPEVLTANLYEQMKHKQHQHEKAGNLSAANRIHSLLRGFLAVVLEGEKALRAA